MWCGWGVITAESTYSIAYQVYSTGTQVFRVYIPGGPENEGAASQLFSIDVTPVAAALLTPEAPGNSTQPSEAVEGDGETAAGSEGGEGSGGGEQHLGRHEHLRGHRGR